MQNNQQGAGQQAIQQQPAQQSMQTIQQAAQPVSGGRTIDLLELLSLYVKRIWIIILSAILAGSAAFGYTYFFVTPQYQSSALFYVNNNSVSLGGSAFTFSASEISAAQSLVDTYIVILTSIPTIEEVIEEADVDYTYSQLVNMITASAVNSTEIFRATVTDSDPYEAELIANTIATVLPERIAEVVKGSDVSIVQHAVVASRRSSPNYSRNTMLGAFLGILMSVAILTINFYYDEYIRSEDYLTATYPEYPLLGVLPDATSSGKKGRGYYRAARRGYGYGYGYTSANSGEEDKKAKKKKAEKKKKDTSTVGDETKTAENAETEKTDPTLTSHLSFAASEAYKLLRTNINFAFSNSRNARVIAVTSSFRSEGKTTVAINTAYTIAETGKRVLLIDADLRLSATAKRLNLSNAPGLSNVLAEMNTDKEVIQTYSEKPSSDADTVSMDVLVAGNIPPNPSELLESERMAALIDNLRQEYDYIIVDLPPVTEVTDALIVSRVVDGLVIIVRHNVALRGALADMIRQIRLVNARIAGFVYNGSDESNASYYKKRGYYYKRGYYKKRGYYGHYGYYR